MPEIIPTRRSLFVLAAALPLALAAAGCVNGSLPSAQIEQAIADVQTIASGLAGVLPQLGQIAGIPAAILTEASTIISEIQSVASQMAGATDASSAQPLVKQIESLVNALVGAATPFVAGVPGVGQVFAAVTVLLPVIEAAVGLFVPAQMARRPAMTPAEARLILRAAAR